jgi:hypothetical protein
VLKTAVLGCRERDSLAGNRLKIKAANGSPRCLFWIALARLIGRQLGHRFLGSRIRPEGLDNPNQKRRRGWLAICLVVTVANVALWGIFWNHFARKEGAAASTLPWSVLFNSSHALQLISSDPDIDEIQGYTGQQISVSDYANHNYIPYPEKLTTEINQICHILLHGNKASLVDAPIAVNVAELAQASSKKVEIHSARSVQLSNFQTDDNFVLLGSPRSNPWAAFLAIS